MFFSFFFSLLSAHFYVSFEINLQTFLISQWNDGTWMWIESDREAFRNALMYFIILMFNRWANISTCVNVFARKNTKNFHLSSYLIFSMWRFDHSHSLNSRLCSLSLFFSLSLSAQLQDMCFVFDIETIKLHLRKMSELFPILYLSKKRR